MDSGRPSILEYGDAARSGVGNDGRLLAGADHTLPVLAVDPPLYLQLDVDRARAGAGPDASPSETVTVLLARL